MDIDTSSEVGGLEGDWEYKTASDCGLSKEIPGTERGRARQVGWEGGREGDLALRLGRREGNAGRVKGCEGCKRRE